MISQALAEAPIVRFTVDERAYRGDGVPRDFSGKPLDWFLQMQAEGATWEE
ncbi:hypothetical protein CQR55_0142 [Bifidobacterium pseudolongum subsp. globosum]|uniref:hypothetical protein n=1 Tax=Bifidobacterium pseudolongum TaxID=1694 RepID=UPI000CC9D3D2|nr:hypothetical protein [Bifidobacterium pseudolongum]PKU98511.1 hypothetical protein CQR55_0142 [Bifidobacterium pseudolongum subsp. globosum]